MTGFPNSNHMPITPGIGAPKAPMLIQAVESLRDAIQQMQTVQGIMAQCASDTTYADLETTFGLTNNGTSGTTSTGYNAQYQVNAACTALADSTITQMLAQLG